MSRCGSRSGRNGRRRSLRLAGYTRITGRRCFLTLVCWFDKTLTTCDNAVAARDWPSLQNEEHNMSETDNKLAVAMMHTARAASAATRRVNAEMKAVYGAKEKAPSKRAIASAKRFADKVVTKAPGGFAVITLRQAREGGKACADADVKGDLTKHKLAEGLHGLNGDAVAQTAALNAARDGYSARYAEKRPNATPDAVENATKQFAMLLRAGVRILAGGRELPDAVRYWNAAGALLNSDGTLKAGKTEADFKAASTAPALQPLATAKGADGKTPPPAPHGAAPDPAAATLPGKPVTPSKGHGDGENPFTAQAYRANAAALRNALAPLANLPGFTNDLRAKVNGVIAFLELNAQHAASE